MGIGVSIILIAAGAILAWAVHADANGFNIHTVGYILLAVGGIGWVVAVNLIIWTGIFLYLLRLGARLRDLEIDREKRP